MNLDDLERLQKLKESGALSQEEFEAQKHRILNPIVSPKKSNSRVLKMTIGIGISLVLIAGLTILSGVLDEKSPRDIEKENLANELEAAIEEAKSMESLSSLSISAIGLFEQMRPTLEKDYKNSDPCLQGEISSPSPHEIDINADGITDVVITYDVFPVGSNDGSVCGNAWMGSKGLMVMLNNEKSLRYIGEIPNVMISSEVSFGDNEISITSPKWLDNDPRCCPSGKETTKYHVRSDKIRSK